MAGVNKKNLISNRDVYNKYYGDFRGVDFSSDHTQVIDRRFAYSVNMYKDYLSGQGGAIETVPGFRKRLEGLCGEESIDSKQICGIHPFKTSDKTVVYIHCCERLYFWEDISGETSDKTEIAPIYISMSLNNSKSFLFNNRLYIIDGENILYFEKDAPKTPINITDTAYIPTTYINIIPNGDNRNIGTEYENRNLLQSQFKHTFIADGATTEYYMNERFKSDKSNITVKVYGKNINDFNVILKDEVGVGIEFTNVPESPIKKGYPEYYAGVEITVECIDSLEKKHSSLITNCTKFAVFHNRIFLTGNPTHPNRVYFCGMHDGYADLSYFPDIFYFDVGVSDASITGMLAVSDTLMVLKGNANQEASVYFYKPVITGDDLYPVRYEGTRGVSGVSCLGPCINYLDDPVYISDLGVEAMGQLSVRLERAVEHRSSLVDAKLVNLNLSKAVLEVWNGYLVLLVDGKIFLADARQRYTHETGVMQYEWYYLEDIGVYEGQYKEYHYAEESYGLDSENVKITEKSGDELKITLCPESLRGLVVNPPNNYGKADVTVYEKTVTVTENDISNEIDIAYVTVGDKNYLCETEGKYIGGVFESACVIKNIDNNLFFGTTNGTICSFNFDKREKDGVIPIIWYSFNGRTINCGVATKMDNCGIPHLTKNTVKKSTVIKTKTFQSSSAKIMVRTNNVPYKQIERINSSFFSFDNIDFRDFTFETSTESLFSISEKEKRWVEKQYYIYSDEYLKPFALYNISFRYIISGRYKN